MEKYILLENLSLCKTYSLFVHNLNGLEHVLSSQAQSINLLTSFESNKENV